MKVIIAPDSFKESLSALEVANAIEKGFRDIFPEAEYVKIPMADGGEGTVQSLVDATGGRIVKTEVTGPLGDRVQAFFGMLGDGKTAVIEMAAASGLHLVPSEKRNPLVTTTRGTGELILAALDEGAEHIIIGIGGSATNDGGAGMIQALGGRLLDRHGKEIGPGGGSLSELADIDLSGLDVRLKHVKIEVACDVDNPLTGPKGASAIFGPQKGATPEMVATLDSNLKHYADVIERVLGKQVKDIPGAGAAGGLGAGLLAFLEAKLKRGVEIVLETVNFHERIQGASLVITGEGRIDRQTIFGKTPIGVAKAAKRHNIPVIAIAGSVSDDSDVVRSHGIDALYSIVPGIIPLEKALANARYYVTQTARNIAAVCKIGRNMN
ncbi:MULTISPECIES: glycerate kinase [unclassified Geobacillus]|uniref:glycerate kinase n=1 Tax=unclassified Geobacillus TaxID=2642459 RepID=UPI000BE41FA2|nr:MULTISPECIES: glycerate kinase [unclassified Geobacillus]PDM39499.1 glycerate kinase [Parageobacillus yumthangensis]RDV22284.1 glycerate kinase [Parageobacillus toebii]TXK91325.1 glycerate kinase [Parageobacillus sp. SY1]PUF88087.1 glycerate kinase [Geobacillus sp. LYN3]TXK87293.1 glycerate kinase [Geobacillus sp. AYS3]